MQFQVEGPGCHFLNDYYTGKILVVHVWSVGDELRTHFTGIEEACPHCQDKKQWLVGLLAPEDVELGLQGESNEQQDR